MGKVINVQMDEDFYNEIIQGGGEASTIEYLDISNHENGNLINHSILVRIELDGDEGIIATSNFQDRELLHSGITKMIAIDFTLRLKNPMFDLTIKDYLIENFRIDEEWLNSIPRVTKEEFYNLEVFD